MDKFKEIRPIVLGLAVRNNKLLVSEGFDTKKNQTFYRCLGGGIEFLEKKFYIQKKYYNIFKELKFILKLFLLLYNTFIFSNSKHVLVSQAEA